MSRLVEALIAAGWLEPDVTASNVLNVPKAGDDLLPLLVQIAQQATGKSAHPTMQSVLAWAQQLGAKLTVGWPDCEARPLEHWIGPRLMWWPRGIPDGRKVAWVSSRLGRAIDERPDWFAVLRSAVAKLDPAHDVLLTAPSTTVDRFLERAAILFGLRRLRIHLDERRTLVDWLVRLRRQLSRNYLARDSETQIDAACSEVFVSPVGGWALLPVPHSENKDGQECPSSVLPLSDRVLIAAADRVLALQVRSNGNLHQLLRARLTDPAWPTASVWLALGESLVSADVATELQSLGAVGWWLFVADASGIRPQELEEQHSDARRVGHEEFPWPDGDYLVHWTRRRDGPWPDQSETDFIDDLLLSRESSSHSAFAALSRIVQQRRLIASAAGIRGETGVVSFSANPLSELAKQRTFRAHRGRWDSEAFGLCVRRDWLHARGAKPVIYGDDASWTMLSDSDRPFFQLQTTRARRGAKVIDWSQEAEWRVSHDLDLSEASRDDVVLFVPSAEEARQLAAISPWPVFVLSNDSMPRGHRINEPL